MSRQLETPAATMPTTQPPAILIRPMALTSFLLSTVINVVPLDMLMSTSDSSVSFIESLKARFVPKQHIRTIQKELQPPEGAESIKGSFFL
ncbi:MAG TPA: hypothetical protein VN784_02105 [Candidatus Limnocylindrales bacterium]|nr:hypothetical protein [Candidatus Limnocylindrales bacterium]